ncbi:MAG: hypothetical protein WB810_09490 [Candidatus Cybelea sp.]
MKKIHIAAALALLAIVPGPVGAQLTSGAHAFDWMLGNWTCKNALPSALGGPAIQTLTATRSSTTGAIVWRYTGESYDQYGFLSYVPKTGTWWFSWAYPGGSTGNESTKQSGKKTIWTGMIYDASGGKTMHIRDTYTMYSSTKFNDLGEDDSSGTMKPGYNGTCTKS